MKNHWYYAALTLVLTLASLGAVAEDEDVDLKPIDGDPAAIAGHQPPPFITLPATATIPTIPVLDPCLDLIAEARGSGK